jgi:tRNA A-37 threonylcarbamoyl transferase component Bud32
LQSSKPETFNGGGRYRIIRELGSGGMGIVYEAEDRERGQRVALKTLRQRNVDALYWLKREFRALADIAHTNLVTLYDLVVDDERCFFTMEMVQGKPLLQHCAATQPRAGTEPGEVPYADTWGRRRGLACHERRLRECLRQLALGLSALHDAGKIHCDIKPSNVLVTPEGRVVLLDFGLVEDVRSRTRNLIDGQVFGTVAYMSPEQAGADRDLTPAADWYCVGSLLYEALTGQLPFTGSLAEILFAKQEHAPAPPRAIVPVVPPDLDDLCVALLASNPKKRPEGTSVLRRLGAVASPVPAHTTTQGKSQAVPFTGRGREVEALTDRFYRVAGGRTAAALVRGPSGIGKSELARAFLAQLRERYHGLVVLEGRCYERERIPYKAMDALVDDLSSHWMQLGRKRAEELLPKDAALLPRLFPVLGRVPLIAAAGRKPIVADASEARARASAALRQVLTNLAVHQPTVLYLDDMQWVDPDTVNLLSDLMREPDPPPLLLLLCSRSQVGAQLERLCTELAPIMQTLDLAPLDNDDALALANRLLGSSAGKLAERLTAEAAGSPFFLHELAHYIQSADTIDVAHVDLDRVIAHRIYTLPEGAQRLLEVVAVAGQPVTRRVAASAADLDTDEMTRDARILHSLNFVRTAGGRSADFIEPYHDRIREAVDAVLTEERRSGLHRALALAFEQWNEGAPDQLARHWHGAGETARAAEHTRAAADAAKATLDFEHAAHLYKMTLDLDRGSVEQQRTLLSCLGEALAGAGRPGEAADAFLQAAAFAESGDRLELRRRSAEELLRGGHLERGLDAIRAVLHDIGMKLPRGPRSALVSLVLRRFWLRLRGMRWKRRHRSEIAPRELARIDVCWSVTSGLAIVDPIFGTEYQARHIRLALRAGEPERVARALGSEATLLAVYGHTARAKRAAAQASEITASVNTPYGEGLAEWGKGAVAYFADNDWRTALRSLTTAEESFRYLQSAGWELDTCHLYNSFCLMYLGELKELARRVPAHILAAERRGDLHASTNFRARLNLVWLMEDDVEGAERDLAEALAGWVPAQAGVYHIQHLWALFSGAELDLYRGHPAAAHDALESTERAVRRSMLLHVRMLQAEWSYLRGRAALAQAATLAPEDRARQRFAKLATGYVRKLSRMSQPMADGFGALLHAGIEHLLRGPAEAEPALRKAIERLVAHDMGLHVVAAQRRLGQCTPGAAGRKLVDEADVLLRAQGVRSPERLTNMLLPGW